MEYSTELILRWDWENIVFNLNNVSKDLEFVNSDLTPKETCLISLHWALEPILVTDKEQSIAGLKASINKDLLVYNWPSVIEMRLVFIKSVISELIVSTIGKIVIDPLK